MNSSRGERKCALMLATLAASDRRQLLAQLPPAAASRIKRLVGELQALRLPIAELAQALLADEVVGLTSETSLDVEQLMGLAAHLPDAWYARVLAAWGSWIDRSACRCWSRRVVRRWRASWAGCPRCRRAWPMHSRQRRCSWPRWGAPHDPATAC